MKKVLIINTYLNGGGAAIAACRLANALCKTGRVEVKMLCLHGNNEIINKSRFNISSLVNEGSFSIRERINFIGERLQIYLNNGFNKNKLFHISTSLWGIDISNHPLVLESDIIHLHWTCQGMVSLKSLEKISKLKKTIIWTMHDMWPITAVSPHLDNPNIYVSPWSNKEEKMVNKVWNIKKRIYPILNPVFVGCSKWIKEKALKSDLANGLSVVDIPNPIDTNKYKPKINKEQNKYFTFIFGAVNTSDERKGFRHIIDAINILRDKDILNKLSIKIKVFGYLDNDAKKIVESLGVEYIGYISSQDKMIELYQCSDCLVVPSMFENLPNTIMEAMSCGVPTIAFNVGGIPEMINNGETGFISKIEDAGEGLADCINKLAYIYQNNFEEYLDMCSKCIDKVDRFYSEKVVAQKYIELYETNFYKE